MPVTLLVLLVSTSKTASLASSNTHLEAQASSRLSFKLQPQAASVGLGGELQLQVVIATGSASEDPSRTQAH